MLVATLVVPGVFVLAVMSLSPGRSGT